MDQHHAPRLRMKGGFETRPYHTMMGVPGEGAEP
jgi:hypothetical protein